MSYDTLRVRVEDNVWYVQLHRPEANNTIDGTLLAECADVLGACRDSASVVVLEGLPDVFCLGADLSAGASGAEGTVDPKTLYGLWMELATGPFVSVAHVRGKTNAGGVGFVAASDIVLAEEKATFSLSELMFGLFPACVMPFLVRRVGMSRARFLALSTQPVEAAAAKEWGLVDACAADSVDLLRRQLLRLRRLPKDGIARFKRYLAEMDTSLADCRAPAERANREIFSDERNLARIARFVETGRMD